MKKTLSGAFIFVFLIALIVIISFPSCSKNSNNSNGPGNSPTALWPLKAGNQWVYSDSLFNDSLFISANPDTVTALAQTYHDPSGFPLYELTGTGQGWFYSGNFAGVDPNNDAIFLMDTLGAGSYLFFGTTNQDGIEIGSGTDFSNPTCPTQYSQYGFASTVAVKTYTCLRNVEYATDCNGVNQEVIIIYVSPGVGVVRIEDYELNSSNNLYLSYSQTLQSYTLAK
ncbi:MAG: hypothetical protein P4L51_02410 [Puia sp.]|nr:hypothetical protein [Puia sp.]